MIVLRFRDLTVPDNVTIDRHQELARLKGAVWWGWIMRQDETFPTDFIVALSARLSSIGAEDVLLFHSGMGTFFRARMAKVNALPNGTRIRSPDHFLTPPYMHESVCPAWFELTEIANIESIERMRLISLPTLSTPSDFDQSLLSKGTIIVSDLRNSGATLWEIENIE